MSNSNSTDEHTLTHVEKLLVAKVAMTITDKVKPPKSAANKLPEYAVQQTPYQTSLFFLDAVNQRAVDMTERFVSDRFKQEDFIQTGNLALKQNKTLPTVRDLLGEINYNLALDYLMCGSFEVIEEGPLLLMVDADAKKEASRKSSIFNKQVFALGHGFVFPTQQFAIQGNGFVIVGKSYLLESMNEARDITKGHKQFENFNPLMALGFWRLKQGSDLNQGFGDSIFNGALEMDHTTGMWLLENSIRKALGEKRSHLGMKFLMSLIKT